LIQCFSNHQKNFLSFLDGSNNPGSGCHCESSIAAGKMEAGQQHNPYRLNCNPPGENKYNQNQKSVDAVSSDSTRSSSSISSRSPSDEDSTGVTSAT